jgi:hypothetical protein
MFVALTIEMARTADLGATCVQLLRAYPRYDNLADMERKRTARDADPAWGEFQSLTEGMILAQG